MAHARTSDKQKASGCLGCLGLLSMLSCGGLLLLLWDSNDVRQQAPVAPNALPVPLQPAENDSPLNIPRPETDQAAGSKVIKPTSPFIFHVTTLAGKSASEVDAILGIPKWVEPNDYPPESPGEFRSYDKNERKITVRFFRGRAVHVVVDWVDSKAATSTEALGAVGIDERLLTKTLDDSLGNVARHCRYSGTIDDVPLTVFVVRAEPNCWIGVATDFLRAGTGSESTREIAPARFIAHFRRGKPKPIAGYVEDGDSYIITGPSGGRGRYTKSMIDHFESLDKDTQQSPARRWRDKSGKFSVDAELVGMDGETVRLKRADGKTVTVQLEKVSDEDRQYIENHHEAAGIPHQ